MDRYRTGATIVLRGRYVVTSQHAAASEWTVPIPNTQRRFRRKHSKILDTSPLTERTHTTHPPHTRRAWSETLRFHTTQSMCAAAVMCYGGKFFEDDSHPMDGKGVGRQSGGGSGGVV